MTGSQDRRALMEAAGLAADHLARRRSDPVARAFDPARLRARVAAFDFVDPMDAAVAAGELFEMLRDTGVRSDHPCYFGLFNPPALVPGIVGDIVAATANPQLAVWGHAPAAAEIEQHLVGLFGRHIWGADATAGTFTSGGSEANHTALLAALARRYPSWAEEGLASLDKSPAIYVSAQAHLAWLKIARAAGLGARSVRLVPTRDGLALDGDTLEAAIARDDAFDPVLVVATAGTTAHGAIDDLAGIAAAGQACAAHVHVDAAWAGAVLLEPGRRSLLAGIEKADSVTIDPHKWLAVPMGAGLYLAREWAPLETAFGVSTSYMPTRTEGTRDAYINSLQWSRRFTGAKLFVALATLGLSGYAAQIERQFALGDRLRDSLRRDGWRIVNDTELPLVCFVPDQGDDQLVANIERTVVASGDAWISTVALGETKCLRACVSGFETSESDIDTLVELLSRARRAAAVSTDRDAGCLQAVAAEPEEFRS